MHKELLTMSKDSNTYKKIDVSAITGNLELYEGVTKNTPAKLEFAKKQLEGRSPEDQQNILYSVIKDLGPKADKHPVVDALKIYMAREGVSPEKINNISNAAKGSEQVPAPEAPKQAPEAPKSEILNSPKPKAQSLQKGPLQEAEKIKLSEKIEPKVSIIEGDLEKEAEKAVSSFKNPKIGSLKTPKTDKLIEKYTTTPPASYSKQVNQQSQSNIGSLQHGSTPKSSKAEIQGLSAPAQDSITFTPPAGTGASADLDAITEAVRKEILLKQQRMLQREMAERAESEEEKNKIKKFNNAEFRDYVKGEGKDKAKAALSDERFQRKLNVVETLGYQKIHEKFKDSFKNIDWQDIPPSTRTIQVTNNSTISETTHNQNPQTVRLSDGSVKTVSSYRTIDFPKDLKDKGPLHLSMAVKDENGQNISEKDAVYFTAHYDKDGKLTEVSSPMPVKFMGNGPEAVGYIERDGKIYTLPVNHAKYQEMMMEVEKNGKNVNLAQGPGENIAAPQQMQQQGQGSQAGALPAEGAGSPKFSQSQQEAPSPPDPSDPYVKAFADSKSNPAKGLKDLSDLLCQPAEKVVEILKEQVKKGHHEVVGAIIELTKDTSHKNHFAEGNPVLKPEQYKEVYDTAMETAKASVSKQANMKAICNTLAPVAKVDPLTHSKNIETLEKSQKPQQQQGQQQASKPSELQLFVTGRPTDDPTEKWTDTIDNALKGKSSKEVVDLLKQEVGKGRDAVVEQIVKAIDPNRKDKPADIPALNKDQYKEVYMHGMKNVAPNEKDQYKQLNIHKASGKLLEKAEISNQFHVTKIQDNSKLRTQQQGKGK